MSGARYAFAAHPEALDDLHRLPDEVRDVALLQLQDLVRGHLGAKRLEGRLEGFHKVYIDPAAGRRQWRMVVQFRDAPLSSTHSREVYLIAAGARRDYEVYRAAQLRTDRAGLNQPAVPDATEARVRAARVRSPHPGQQQRPPAPFAAPAAVPSADTDSRRALR